MQGLKLSSRGFTDSVQLETAVAQIRRYQKAYMTVNKVNSIIVKWKKGWYAIKPPVCGWSFHRPTSFRNMTDALEQRIKEIKQSKQ